MPRPFPLLATSLALALPAMAAVDPTVLPWQREPSLAAAAAGQTMSAELDPSQPTGSERLALSNAQVRSAIWGPPNRVTVSLLKTDVWDRRYGLRPTVTLAQVRAGAESPANRGFDDMPPNRRRPVRGWLPPDGSGRVDPYACWNAYPFPCEKPVGQVIVGLDELGAAPDPTLVQNCADGTVRLQLRRGTASADLTYALAMEGNVIAIRGRVQGVARPWLRLYRHEDQAYLRYMLPDRKTFRAKSPGGASGRISETSAAAVPFDYAKDAAWNGPVEPPSSGADAGYFWIHQRFPPERTFPRGFDYVLMGRVAGTTSPEAKLATRERGLGTLPRGEGGETGRLEDGYAAIRAAPGAAATVTLPTDAAGAFAAYVVVVTCNDAPDPMAEARRRLDAAAAGGFASVASANAAWYRRLYDRREDGRVFLAGKEPAATESVPEVMTSWSIHHGGTNDPDMRRFEATAAYANLEQDWQLWHSLPCYNEIFYTATAVRHRSDALGMWWKLVEAWRPAAEANAREVFGVPEGMALVHGYLPPIRPDHYVHTNVAMEDCVDTIAQMVKPLWDEWDYGGDEAFLRRTAYPAIRDAAQFYANYAQSGSDGCWHFAPALEAEAWGIFPGFARGRDSISSLCMARWTFRRAAAAAELLGVDAGPRRRWLQIEAGLAPYPSYPTPQGPIFNSVAGTVPSHHAGDHPWYIGLYPTSLADEINLDSSPALKAEMVRTARTVRTARSGETLILLGAQRSGDPEALLNSRSGRIHVFPAVAPDGPVAFRRFQARGGFLVSAVRAGDRVTWLEIEARRALSCPVMNPWPGERVGVVDLDTGRPVPVTVDRANGECLIFSASAGGHYRIRPVSPGEGA